MTLNTLIPLFIIRGTFYHNIMVGLYLFHAIIRNNNRCIFLIMTWFHFLMWSLHEHLSWIRSFQLLAYLLSNPQTTKKPRTPPRHILITLSLSPSLFTSGPEFKTTINLPECLLSPQPQPMIDESWLWRGRGWTWLEFHHQERLCDWLGPLRAGLVARGPLRHPPPPHSSLPKRLWCENQVAP